MALTPDEKREIQELVRTATRETMAETFRAMGINHEDWNHLEEWHENHKWVSKYRKLSERVGSTVVITIVTLMTGSGVAYMLGDYFWKK